MSRCEAKKNGERRMGQQKPGFCSMNCEKVASLKFIQLHFLEEDFMNDTVLEIMLI